MIKKLWLNLPVKDLVKSREFFSKLGFSFDTEYGNSDDSACFVVGEDDFRVMLFPENTFKNFTKNELSDTKIGSEMLISIDAESRAEVDEMARKAFDAGGAVFSDRRNIKAGCTAAASPIWMGIGGMFCIWISAGCPGNSK